MKFSHRHLLNLCVPVLVLCAVLHAFGALRLNTNLQAGDQGAYLHLALAQKEGIALTDGNRHPLYSAMLIPLAEREPRFFARARWLSVLIGILFLLLLARNEVKIRHDPISAILVLGFLSLHVQMTRTLSEIWCEPLLYLLVYLLWSMLDRARDSDTLSSNHFTLWGGILTGSVYLCKGTGLQVAVFFWVVVLWFAKTRIKPLVGISLFLIVASPLFIWNHMTYRDPLYSFASTHNMWFDEADEIWYDDPKDLPTLGSYLASHSPGEILGRLGRGLILEARMACQLLWSDWRLPEGSTGPAELVLFLMKLLVVAGVCWAVIHRLRRRDPSGPVTSRPALFFFLLMFLFMFPAFGWYAQLTDEPRFLMTLTPIFIVLLARWISRTVAPVVLEVGNNPSKTIVLLCAVFSLFALTQTASFAWKTRSLPDPTMDPLARKILEEVERLPESSKIAFGPSHGLPLWLSRTDLEWRPTPWRIELDRFKNLLEREQIGYVLVDGETLARRPYLSALAGPSASEEFGWTLRARFRDNTGFFILYEVSQ